MSSRMLGIPRVAAEIRSDCRPIRLRSRQVSCITGSTPADIVSRLPAKLDSRTWVDRALQQAQILGPAVGLSPPKAINHTHRTSGCTSHIPVGDTPPHGPLHSCLGQVIGHAYPVTGSVHWPHIRQPNVFDFTSFSARVKTLYARGCRSRNRANQRFTAFGVSR